MIPQVNQILTAYETQPSLEDFNEGATIQRCLRAIQLCLFGRGLFCSPLASVLLYRIANFKELKKCHLSYFVKKPPGVFDFAATEYFHHCIAVE